MGIVRRIEGSRDAADKVSEQLSAASSSSSSLITDDGHGGGEVTSTSPRYGGDDGGGGGGGGDCSFSSSESESDEEEMAELAAGGGPLYELAAPLLAHLPIRTGLSNYYQGKSQSFTSLCNAKCVEDLAKKTTPYITRLKLRRGHGVAADRLSNSRRAPGPCSKTMARKTPRCSSDRLLSSARSTSLFTSAAADHLHIRARKSCHDAT
uniref:Uncharacterized protein n=1 Tax=Leersia perrieri TaxID=77586 RepID=A0A0D9WR82_9ORYZ